MTNEINHQESTRAVPESEVSAWDVETDVLVVGGGAAGLSAAIEAAHSGARVTLIERASDVGGTTSMSGGLIYLGGGTGLQTACGFEDSAEAMFDFLRAALGPGTDEERLRTYCDGSVEHYDWLVELGVPFKETLFEEPTSHPTNDDGLMWLGEDAAPFADLARPAPRGHHPQMADLAGSLLTSVLAAAGKKVGVEFRVDTQAKRLVVDEKHAVVGLIARQYGEDVSVRARSVILAAGGFGFNDSMLAEHVPVLLGHNRLGTDNDDGRGIRIAQAVGAGTRHMGAAEVATWADQALMYRSLCVNDRGQRFINEDIYHGLLGQAALLDQRGQVFMVFDERTYESVPPELRRGQRPTWVCESVTELETEMGLPPLTLQATVDTYNVHAREGHDPVFGKNAEYVAPLQAPFAAIDMRSRPFRADGRSGYSTFTLGGVATDVDGRVLDVDGAVIQRLYAAGRTAAGLSGRGYISGTSIGDGSFFGRRAGQHSAQRAGGMTA